MEGACSNQVVKCIIYATDLEVGRKKLAEIEEEKQNNGISIIRKTKSDYNNQTIFSDGDEWIIVNPAVARGYRWRKAWIDVKTSIELLWNVVLPSGALYKWENEKYFNWDTCE